jgi:hypothetical protein
MRTGAAAFVVLAGSLGVACGSIETDRPPPIGGTLGSSPGAVGGELGGGDGDVDGGPAGGGQTGAGQTGGGQTGGGQTGAGQTGGGQTGAGQTGGLQTGGLQTGGALTGFASADTFGTSVDLSVLSGSILSDDTLFPLPMNCSVRMHEPGAVDPGTGLSSGALLDVPVTLEGPQQLYDIGLDQVQEIVNQGDLVYVEVRCDVNGDGAFDDVGGWFPLLPAEIVELPAEDIDLVIGDLPV